MRAAVFLLGGLAWTASCGAPETHEASYAKLNALVADARPYARYWWFAEDIDTADIAYNLGWLHARGFGGVELAFVYPPGRMREPRDSTLYPKAAWLSPEWQALVAYTYRRAGELGLGVDITAGSLWPFGDGAVSVADGSKTWGGGGVLQTSALQDQPITAHWSWPAPARVVDHLSPRAYLRYLTRTLDSFPVPTGPTPARLFVDSWEVDTRGLWTDGFGEAFAKTYGYRIEPYMDSLYAPGRERERYDYHALLSDRVLGFYRDFDSVANARGYLSRGQVSGAPVDLIDGYRALDVPESEALLFEPPFSRIPAAAAAIEGRPLVSAETFTCLYGWPREHLREEQVADLKLLADALFVNGVNEVVWHGKPHTRRHARDSTNFYAAVHLGDSSLLTPHLRDFNAYLTTVSRHLRRGRPYHQVAQYLPTEDAWLAGEMPIDRQFVWAWGHYEMRYVEPSAEVAAYAPLWVNGSVLAEAQLRDGRLHVGETSVEGLYVKASHVDARIAPKVEELREAGFPVIVKRPAQLIGAGGARQPEGTLASVMTESATGLRPTVTSSGQHVVRVVGDTLVVFFASAKTRDIAFPMAYGQSAGEAWTLEARVNSRKAVVEIDTVGQNGQTFLYEIVSGRARAIDIGYVPPAPEVDADTTTGPRAWEVQ